MSVSHENVSTPLTQLVCFVLKCSRLFYCSAAAQLTSLSSLTGAGLLDSTTAAVTYTPEYTATNLSFDFDLLSLIVMLTTLQGNAHAHARAMHTHAHSEVESIDDKIVS